MKKIRVFSLCAISLAVAACSGDSSLNQLGSISVSGTPTEGETLTATVSDPDGIDESTAVYRWLIDGSQIEGATSSTLVLTANEAGESVYASVVYVDNNGVRESHTSLATEAVTGLPTNTDNASSGDDDLAGESPADETPADDAPADDTPTPDPTPVDDPTDSIINTVGTVLIDGAATAGQTLTATISDTNGIAGSASYQWVADGTAIDGATSQTFLIPDSLVGSILTVSVEYTDNAGFEEAVSSEATSAVLSAAVNTPASITIAGSSAFVVGTEITVSLTEPNGATTSPPVYEWQADGAVISGETAAAYTPTSDVAGKILSVSTSFTDDEGNAETASFTAQSIVYSDISTSLSDLQTIVLAASDGDVIGLGTGDYSSTDDVLNAIDVSADDLTLVKVKDSTAVISGNICLEVSGNNVVIDGLDFSDIALIAGSSCESNGPSSIYLTGDNITFKNNTITDEAASHGLSDFVWIGVKGLNNVLTRNAFSDSTMQRDTVKGAVISIYNNSDSDSQEGHTVSYNLFKDFGFAGEDANGDRNSSAYMIQVGRSTGSSSQEDGLNTVEFNLFKNVNLDRRYMRVQSGNNIIRNNTFLDGSGMIALEDGNNNTVSGNVFINTVGDNPDDGGISYGPYGHTITNNYIAGLRTTSGDRGGIFANSDVVDGSGNSTATVATVTVANNTILNSREAIEFSSKECQDGGVTFIVDFDNNLVANGETGALTGNENNGQGREAIQDDCTIDASSDFDGNHIYSSVYTNSGTNFMESFAGSADNLVGAEAGADIVAAANGLWMGQNTDAGKGADASILTLLTEADVGPDSE